MHHFLFFEADEGKKQCPRRRRRRGRGVAYRVTGGEQAYEEDDWIQGGTVYYAQGARVG